MRLPSLRSERPATVATAALEIPRDPKRDALVHGFFLRVDRRLRETIRVGERHNAEIERPDFGKYQQRRLTRRSDRRILTETPGDLRTPRINATKSSEFVLANRGSLPLWIAEHYVACCAALKTEELLELTVSGTLKKWSANRRGVEDTPAGVS